MAGVSELYLRKFPRKVRQYNKSLPLPDYFKEMVGEKKKVKIAEVGAGPINTIGNYLDGVEVEIYASDNLQPEYEELWKEHGATPLIPVEYQDMERLSYDTNVFDIVHCRNALDHTRNLFAAVKQLKRVCKRGGWVYLAHAPGQKTKYGGKHYWNFEEVVDELYVMMPGIEVTESEDGLIVCRWQKT